jgi:ATP-dependent DNA helicase RecQ
MEQAFVVLKERFGMDGFRKGQWEVISSACRGRDTMAVLPTGGGKSICYQLMGLMTGKLVIVVSPLISLMEDQVNALKKRGVGAGCLHSGQTWEEARAVFEAMKGGFLLYVSPERLVSDSFLESMGEREIGLFAVDEAHCVSQWGHNFRPEYGRLSFLRKWRPGVPVMALTASATPLVLNDISRQLGLVNPDLHIHGFYRSNLYYQAQTCTTDRIKHTWLRKALQQTPTGRVIIYTGTRKDCHDIASEIQSYPTTEEKIGIYHAGLSTEERKSVQEEYSLGTIRILVATNAFGMGIDHPDVRLVVHFRIPSNIDSLYQEMGRAGRDGKESTCLLLYAPRDKGLHAHFIQSSDESPNQKRTHWYRLNTMVEYAQLECNTECRHRSILLYYRQKDGDEMTCGHCDLCAPDSPRRIQVQDQLQLYSIKEKRKTTSRSRQDGGTLSSPIVIELKKWRQEKAKSMGQPVYCVMTNRTMEEIVSKMPDTKEKLAKIHGIGPVKLSMLGEDVIRLVQSSSTL